MKRNRITGESQDPKIRSGTEASRLDKISHWHSDNIQSVFSASSVNSHNMGNPDENTLNVSKDEWATEKLIHQQYIYIYKNLQFVNALQKHRKIQNDNTLQPRASYFEKKWISIPHVFRWQWEFFADNRRNICKTMRRRRWKNDYWRNLNCRDYYLCLNGHNDSSMIWNTQRMHDLVHIIWIDQSYNNIVFVDKKIKLVDKSGAHPTGCELALGQMTWIILLWYHCWTAFTPFILFLLFIWRQIREFGLQVKEKASPPGSKLSLGCKVHIILALRH